MPEIITKHPKIVKQVLESGGAKCGKGLPQKILTKCPRESFCALPGGEVCIYGTDELEQMTQLTRTEICTAPTNANPPAVTGSTSTGSVGMPILVVLGAVFMAEGLRRLRRGINRP